MIIFMFAIAYWLIGVGVLLHWVRSFKDVYLTDMIWIMLAAYVIWPILLVEVISQKIPNFILLRRIEP